ncbi:hypothetical protein BKA63DRAFT_573070 [Paraphoma chrysanthemicola]|nr:hypothetical protein BKA63DRAFT_573070 [Paraphoma chrysanthemicola]
MSLPHSSGSVRSGSSSSIRPDSSCSLRSGSDNKISISIASANGARTVTWERGSNPEGDDERDYAADADLASKDLASAIQHIHTLTQRPEGTPTGINTLRNTYYLPPKPTDTTTCSSIYGTRLPQDIASLVPENAFSTYMVELNIPNTEHVRNMLQEIGGKLARGATLEYSEDDLAQVSHLWLHKFEQRRCCLYADAERRKDNVYCIMLQFPGTREAIDAILTAAQGFLNGKKLAFTSENLAHVNFVQHCPPWDRRGNWRHNTQAHPVTFAKSYGPKHSRCLEQDGPWFTTRYDARWVPFSNIFGLRFHHFQERQSAALLDQHARHLEKQQFFDFYKGNKKVAQDTSETVADVQTLEEVENTHPTTTIWEMARNSLQNVVPFWHSNASLNHVPDGMALPEGQANNNGSDNTFINPDKFKEVAAKSHQAKVRFEQAEELRKEKAAQVQQKLLQYDNMLVKLSAESPSPVRNQKLSQLEVEYTNFLSHMA